MLSTYRYAALAATLGLSWAVPKADAAYVAYMYEDNHGNVLASGSGSIDISDLTATASDFLISPGIDPSNAALYLGAPGSTTVYASISGPTSFGSPGEDATTGSGATVGIYAGGNYNSLLVPDGYMSGASLGTSTATLEGTSFFDLGVTIGAYTWTWPTASGGTDSYTLNIGGGSSDGPAVPEPASLSLLAIGLAGLGLVRRARICSRVALQQWRLNCRASDRANKVFVPPSRFGRAPPRSISHNGAKRYNLAEPPGWYVSKFNNFGKPVCLQSGRYRLIARQGRESAPFPNAWIA